MPLGKFFHTIPKINGIDILLVSLVQAVCCTGILYGLQRLHRHTLKDLGLRIPSMSWVNFLLLTLGLTVLGQGLLLIAKKMVWKNTEINLSAFDLSTIVSRLGWMAVG